MSKKYICLDLQGADFMSDTLDKPQSKSKILKRFRSYAFSDDIQLPKKLTLEWCADFWEFAIYPIEKGKFCPHCGRALCKSELEDYSYQCLSCDEDFYEFETK